MKAPATRSCAAVAVGRAKAKRTNGNLETKGPDRLRMSYVNEDISFQFSINVRGLSLNATNLVDKKLKIYLHVVPYFIHQSAFCGGDYHPDEEASNNNWGDKRP